MRPDVRSPISRTTSCSVGPLLSSTFGWAAVVGVGSESRRRIKNYEDANIYAMRYYGGGWWHHRFCHPFPQFEGHHGGDFGGHDEGGCRRP